MNAYLTFDYELYFGSNTGSINKTMIEPTEALVKVANKHNAKLVFFVDAGYLVRLSMYSTKYSALNKTYDIIKSQLDRISKDGHQVQLHIHPHWEDTNYNGKAWDMNLHRYKLASFSDTEINQIVARYKEELSKYSNNKIFAYRAGGWCIQPFDSIGSALKNNNIWLDSTIYAGGYNSNEILDFDFRNAPNKDIYKFEGDPTREKSSGYFTELPISSIKVNPWFYWHLVYTKLFPSSKHEKFGDGFSVDQSKAQILKLLTKKSSLAASTDGLKAQLLFHSIKKSLASHRNHYVSVGHPKSTSRYSLEAIDHILKHYNNQVYFTNFADISF